MQPKDRISKLEDSAPTLREFFAADVFTVRTITTMAVLLAFRTILGLPFLTVYLTPGIKLFTFAYVPDAITAMFFGPIAGLAFGFAGDFLGFVATGGIGGPYFPGFAVSEMATCFLFACFFFRRRITLPRTIIVWCLNLIIVLTALNSLWVTLMYGIETAANIGSAYIEFFPFLQELNPLETFVLGRFLLNAIQAPLHIFIIYMLLTRIRRLDRYIR